MNWIKQSTEGLKTYFLVCIILPLVILAGLETFLLVSYKLTGSRHFETKSETEKRIFNIQDASFIQEISLNQLKVLKDSKGKKIAVFGGSSASGYGSAISFADFIRGSKEDLVVHNYAIPGMAFSDFQSAILLKVMKYYDVIIIYAGHNEVWTTLNSKVKTHGPIVAPNGEQLLSDNAYIDLDRRLTRIGYPQDDFTSNSALSIYGLLQDSRLSWFLLKGSNKLKAFIPDRKKLTQIEKYPYFGDYIYLDETERQVLINRFRNTVIDIARNLNQEQLLVVIPAFSNDLYPPIYQSYSSERARDGDSLETANSRTKTLYTLAKTSAINSGSLAQIPPGSHRNYLHALSCSRMIRGNEVFLGKIPNECVKLFTDARNHDGLPLRSLDLLLRTKDFSDLNNRPNALVKEIIISQTLDSLGVESYLDLFVDFQHPSETGHMVIANAILPLIFPDLKGNYQLNGTCAFRFSSAPFTEIAPEPQRYKSATDTNITWLNRFIDRMPEKDIYEWHRNRASEKSVVCGIVK